MKNNSEDKNIYKPLTSNQFICSAKDRPSSLVDFREGLRKNGINFYVRFVG